MISMQEIRQRAQTVAIKPPDFASILIVDDQRFDRARLRRMCKELEFDVTISEADSLESLGTAMGQDAFDLIFLDYHMSDGSGLQALDAIQFDPRNRNAATIMVTGDEQTEIAINAMKNGCSDFLKKDDLSNASVRRAAINALQKASLNRSLETQHVMRSKVEAVLDSFTEECANELKPMLFKMMRHVRDLYTIRDDDVKYQATIQQISNACNRLFDFMNDIDDQERKEFSLVEVGEGPASSVESEALEELQGGRPRLFGRQPIRPN
ncbi:chemotaxis-specific methylesterase [Roseovarius aestuarii]|uniref:Chemotaxis-specific methylesterase n=2 Tax=Roseovarius aestuarii TaxID=475083 RepID=A0A1X7BKW9_9RHOB|nr:chemotaxis-specific methylesterase [Roseovarius aestuarii]